VQKGDRAAAYRVLHQQVLNYCQEHGVVRAIVKESAINARGGDDKGALRGGRGFRAKFVERRKWLDEAHYLDIVALCQFLPGPASSQVGITVGILRAGLPGAFAAWVGFSGPSVLAMILFGYGVGALGDIAHVPWLHGLKIVAVAVVAQAVWGMARNLCPDRLRASVAVAAALLALGVPSAIGQIGAIVGGGLIGWWMIEPAALKESMPLAVRIARSLAIVALVLFFALLFGLPLLTSASGNHLVGLISSFYPPGRSSSAAGMSCFRCSSKRWYPQDGSGTMRSLPGMVPRRLCRGRCSRLLPILEP
jgi:chromate transport protein ChrA